MVFALLGLVVVVIGCLSAMKWYIYPRRRDEWMGGKWYMGD